jgi:hypothetical protein
MVTERVESTISLFAAFIIGLGLLVFKDLTRRILKAPAGFGYILLVFLFSLFGIYIATPLLYLSGSALISSICAYPLTIWYNYLTRPVTTNDLVASLKEVFNK